jgi:uncharacterized membrane protein
MLEEFMHWLGFGLCHQLPERSYIAGGLQAPVCVRDTGIYVGFVVAFVIVSLLHRGRRPSDFPPTYVWAVAGLLVAAMGVDGVTSYAGLRGTTNELRLITGLGVGFSATLLVVPMLNDLLWRGGGSGRVLDTTAKFLVWLAGIPLSFLVIHYAGSALGVWLSVAIALAVIFTLTAINLVIVAMLPVFDRKATRARQLAAPIAIALVLAFVEIAVAAQFRWALLSLSERLGG